MVSWNKAPVNLRCALFLLYAAVNKKTFIATSGDVPFPTFFAFRMRGVVAIGLLGVLLSPFAGTQVWHGWERYQVRQRIRAQLVAGLPDSALVCLRFSVRETHTLLRWERDDEFVLDGQWYDVVRQAQHGDSVLFWCLPDHAETRLEAAQQQQIAEALAHHTPLRDTLQRLWRFFWGLFWEKTETMPMAGTFWTTQTPDVPQKRNHAQAHHSPPSPPPESKAAFRTC